LRPRRGRVDMGVHVLRASVALRRAMVHVDAAIARADVLGEDDRDVLCEALARLADAADLLGEVSHGREQEEGGDGGDGCAEAGAGDAEEAPPAE